MAHAANGTSKNKNAYMAVSGNLYSVWSLSPHKP